MATGKPELTLVNINSIDVGAYLQSWSSNTNNDNSTIKMVNVVLAKGVQSVLTIDETLNGKTVTIQRGVSTATEKYIFQGEVVSVSPSGGLLVITCMDKMYSTMQRIVTKSFDKDIDTEAGKYSEIFKTLINDFTDLTADGTSIQDSGTTNVITKFICRSVSVFDRLKVLADTIGWQFYYDSDTNKVYFEPEGYSSQVTVIVDSTNMSKSPKWIYDASELYNQIELRGAQQEVETTESGRIGTTGGYTTTSIILTETPTSTKVYADSAATPTTLRTGGISSSTATYDYSVDKEQKTINWSNTYTPGASDYVIIDYSYNLPVPVVVNDSPSQVTYGIKKKVLHKYDIVNVSDAENYASQFILEHKNPIIKSTIPVQDVSDLEVGQKVTIQDNFNSIDAEFVIVRVKKEFPYRNDEIEVVSTIIDIDMFNWEINQRVKRLEEQNASDTDLLVHVLSADREFEFERRYVKLLKTTLGGDVGVYGHPTFGIYGTSFYGASKAVWGSTSFGIWGTMIWGSGGTSFILGHTTYGVLGTSTLGVGGSVETTAALTQGDNTYKEYLYDEDFYRVSTATATWTTATKTISFTSGQYILTEAISKGPTHNYFTLNLGTTTGTLLVEITADNGVTWQTVTLNTRTLFSTPGVEVKIRITENASTTASITPTANTYGVLTYPAIYCKLEE